VTTQTPTSSSPIRPSRRGDPTWELGEGAPLQGGWTEAEYLAREFDGLVEYLDGVLEFLPVPTWSHQFLVDFLHSLLKQHVRAHRLGVTAFAPLQVQVGPGRYREPDVVYVTLERMQSLQNPSEGADLVMEVVSPGPEDRRRDLIEKRADYAAAGIPEYWIVDPETETITVLSLPDGETEYATSREFKAGQTAVSLLLSGFVVDVSACFAAGNGGN